MKLSVNVENLFYRFGFEECAGIYKNAGFDALDYSLNGMVNDASPLNGNDYLTFAEEIRKQADRIGIEINQTHAPFTFPYERWSDETTYREIVYPRLVRSIEISAVMGARVVVMHPLHHFTYRGHEEEIFRLNMDFFRSLIPVCRECGIIVGIENMWQMDAKRKCIVHDTCSAKEEFIRYIDTLDSEYMAACLDTGHIGLPLQDDEAQDVIIALGHDRLKALHVHDNNFRADSHSLPFQGKLNWQAIMNALADIRYSGDFTYEVNTEFMRYADNRFIPIGAGYMADIGRYLIEIAENKNDI